MLYAGWLRSDGFQIISCVGPSAPRYVCYLLETSVCPIAAAADVLVYDPWITCDTDEPDATELIRALRARYAETPVLLLAPDRGFPSGLIALARADPSVRLLHCPDRSDLLHSVSDLIAARRAGTS